MSSLSSPTTGMREKPERRNSDMACRRVFSQVVTTMSVRGTMTSRTTVSLSSNTEWIMSRSSSSMTAVSPAMSSRSRSSASLWNGPSR